MCFLVVDIDHENAAFQWSDTYYPHPNIITLNKDNGRGHYVYFLATPVAKGLNARPKPLSYAAAVHYNMNLILGGDQAYTNLITKNPFHKSFRSTFITDQLFSLEDLARPAIREFGELRDRRKLEVKATGIGRNEDLFETLRHWGYRAVHEFRENSSYVAWCNEVTAQANSINAGFNIPLPDNEVRHTAKSVYNWIWTKYFGSGGKRKGIMNLENAGVDLKLADKQSMGAQFAAQTKREATKEKLIASIVNLSSTGQKVTQKAVSMASGCGIATVKRYWSEVKPQG